MLTHTIVGSPIGPLTLVNRDGVLCGLWMGSRWRARGTPIGERAATGFERATLELAEYFAGERRGFTVLIEMRGDAFQQRVWGLLRRIAFGEARSYGDVARDLGDATLARAVGAANARNPIAILVPCHRVIGSDGWLTGYGGGLERKRFLLNLEASVAGNGSTLF